MSAKNGFCSLCGTEAVLKCSRCNTAFYCGKEHQQKDWPNHRIQCHACEVRHSPETGHYLVASRDINEGEVILTESPFVIGPAHFVRSSRRVCVGCYGSLSDSATTTCPGCRWPACSNVCPGLTEPNWHAAECAVLRLVKRDVNDRPLWSLVLPFRCLLLQKRNFKMWNWLLENAPFAKAKTNKYRSKDDTTAVLAYAFAHSNNINPNIIPKNFSIETMQGIIAVLELYALYFSSSLLGKEIAALYKVASFLQVSCTSNTRLTFVTEHEPTTGTEVEKKMSATGRVVVTALKNIRKGEILTYSFSYPLLPTMKRQTHLVTSRSILCSCARCLDPRELGSDFGTMKCPKCSGWMLPVNTSKILSCDWKCDQNCGETFTADKVLERTGHFQKMYEVLSQSSLMGRMEPESLEKMLLIFESELHPNHELCACLKFVLIKAYGNSPDSTGNGALTDKELKRKAALAGGIVDCIDHLSPAICSAENAAIEFIWVLARTKADIIKRKFASGDWTQDRAIRNVVKCRALFQRALALTRTLEYFDTPKLVAEKWALINWANTNGLEIPEE